MPCTKDEEETDMRMARKEKKDRFPKKSGRIKLLLDELALMLCFIAAAMPTAVKAEEDAKRGGLQNYPETGVILSFPVPAHLFYFRYRL